MADLELSLDDIIKKKNIKTGLKTQKFGEKKQPAIVKRLSLGSKPTFPVNRGVPDARFKLLGRRSDPGPAAVPDARYKLNAIRTRPRPIRRPAAALAMAAPIRRTIAGRLGMHPMDMDVDMYDFAPEMVGRGMPLMRTVQNDSLMALPLRRRPFDWDRPAPEEDMDMVLDRMWANTKPTGFRPGAPDWNDITISVNLPDKPQQGILKRPKSVSPNMPPVIPRALGGSGLSLSQRFNRDRNAEASAKVEALKAQLRAAKGEAPPAPAPTPKYEEGHRIVVSNLVPSVTEEDVQELFGDIGELLSAKLVRPGVAEVVYVHLEDARKAVDVYHNRQLDKQPMKCLLVKNQTRKTLRPPVEIDMSTLRNALHKKIP